MSRGTVIEIGVLEEAVADAARGLKATLHTLIEHDIILVGVGLNQSLALLEVLRPVVVRQLDRLPHAPRIRSLDRVTVCRVSVRHKEE